MFHETLTELLRRKGLTLQQFADEVNVPATSILRWVQGEQQPSRDSVVRLDNALDGEGTLVRAAGFIPPGSVVVSLDDLSPRLQAELSALLETDSSS